MKKIITLFLFLGMGSLFAGAQSQEEKELSKSETSAITFEQILYKNAGVQVSAPDMLGRNAQISVRGLNTMNLYSSPYILVNGVLVRYDSMLPTFASGYELSPLAYVNPDDIESINIINKGSVLSRYGSKGSNGIIEINTKRGHLQGTKVSFSSRFGLQTFNRKNYETMNGLQFKNYLQEYMYNEGIDDEIIENSPVFGDSPVYNCNTDWMKRVTRKSGFYQDYYASLMGGDVDTRYMFSLGYTGKNGEIKNDNLNRVSLLFNLDYFITPKFSITNSLSYANTLVRYSDLGYNYDINPIYQAMIKAPFLSPYNMDSEGNISTIPAGVDMFGKGNPDALVNSLYNKAEQNRLNVLIKASYEFIPELKGNIYFATDYINSMEMQHRPEKGIVNDKYRLRQNQKRTGSELYYDSGVNLEFSKDFNHFFSGLQAELGAKMQRFEHKSNYLRKDISSAIDEMVTMDKGVTDSISGFNFNNTIINFYTDVSTSMMEGRGTLGAGVNVEGNSSFGRNGKWTAYPNVYADFDVVSTKNAVFNLNADLGWTGNSGIKRAYYKNLYYSDNYYGYGGAYFGNNALQNLKPEITRMLDLGFKLSLFSRVNLGMNWYNNCSDGVLLHRDIPQELGMSDQFENTGKILNTGFEFKLAANVIATPNFGLNLWANLSTLHNKILSMNGKQVVSNLGGVQTVSMEGGQIGSFYGYKIAGIFQDESDVNLKRADGVSYQAGDYIIEEVVKDGVIDSKDLQILGSPVPDYFGSFGLNLRWAGFTLSADFSYSAGADVYNKFNSKMKGMSDYSNQSVDVLDRWREGEDNTYATLARSAYHDPSQNNVTSSLWVENLNWMRMKNLTLKYTFDKLGLKFLTQADVYVSADNLFTISNYSGFDTEIVSSMDPKLRGIDFGGHLSPRTFMFGVKLSF